MKPQTIDRFVETTMRRVMDGDDEALNILVMELRPLALEFIPRYCLDRGVPVEVLTQEAVVGLYEALMLWSPVRGPFVALLEGRVMQRLRALFLRLNDLAAAVEEVAA